MSKIITRVKLFTDSVGAVLGRPLAAGAAGGGVIYGIGTLAGSDLLKHPATVVIGGTVTLVAEEAIVRGFGRDPQVLAERHAKNWDDMYQTWLDADATGRDAILEGVIKARGAERGRKTVNVWLGWEAKAQEAKASGAEAAQQN